MMFVIILIINLCLFILGNFVYSPYLPVSLPDMVIFNLEVPIFKILISEACFIFIYTLVDKGNTVYNLFFPFCSVLITLQFLLPNYSFLFYSQNIQYFSVGISVLAVIVNTVIIKKLISIGYSKILSSRTATSIASLVEISLFAFLLDIGVVGAIGTIITRIIYITIIPRWIFHKK